MENNDIAARRARLAALIAASLGTSPVESEETPVKQIKRIALGSEKAVRGEKRDAKVAAALPPVEPIDAAGFLALLKIAGMVPAKRPKTGEPVVRADGTPVFVASGGYPAKRADEVTALRRFGMYDAKGDHGAQLAAATRKARMALDPSLGGDGKVPRTAPTVAGYVAGVYDATARTIGTLKAEIRLLSDLVSIYSVPGTAAKPCMAPVFDLDGTQVIDKQTGFAVRAPIDEGDREFLLEEYLDKLAMARDLLFRMESGK